MPKRKSTSSKQVEETSTTTTTSTNSTPSKKQKVTSKFKYAIDAKDLAFSYGTLTSNGTPVFSNVSLQLVPGGRCVLIGANGTGKTYVKKKKKNLTDDKRKKIKKSISINKK